MEAHLFKEIIEALQPLVDIADAYDQSNLDEIRPEWQGETAHFNHELYTGRGGRCLLTLHDCMVAREVSNNLKKLIGVA